jgi:hypothetical protein
MKIPKILTLGDHIRRIYVEYLEMPGLRLTGAQARRLWDLDQATCQAALEALIDARFLTRTDDGLYVRVIEDAVDRTPPWMARAAGGDQRDAAV